MSDAAGAVKKEKKHKQRNGVGTAKSVPKPSQPMKDAKTGGKDRPRQKRREKEEIRPENGKGKQKDPLQEAILALGGDDEDYALIKDVSDEEEAQDRKLASEEDPALSKEVAKFLKGLGLSKKGNLEQAIIEDEPEDNEEMIEDESSGSSEASPSIEGSDDEEEDDKVQESNLKPANTTASSTKRDKGGAKGKFIFPPASNWYDALPSLPSGSTGSIPSETALHSLSTKAAQLLSADATIYASQNGTTGGNAGSSDAAFLSKILSSGTLSDRLSALTLMVQASPVHNQRALESLKSMSLKKGGGGSGGPGLGGTGGSGKGESLKALRALVDWWVGGGAPERKLKYFRDQPLMDERRTDAHLVSWYFEDWLKKFFFSILQILEALTLDLLPYIRMQAMSLISQLLINKPEQEQNLLKLLVNKLGDSDRSIASKSSYHLHTLLQSHPQMKGIVVREVSSLVLKAPTSHFKPSSKKPGSSKDAQSSPSINAHARYYAIVTFNQIVLSSKTQGDKDVATRLVEVYFELFRGILGEGKQQDNADAEVGDKEEAESSIEPAASTKTGKGREEKRKMRERERIRAKGKDKGKQRRSDGSALAEGGVTEDSESKVISAILTGVNRALPFAGMDNEVLNRHMDTLFRITHEATFNVTIQALVLIQKVSENRKEVLPRYMRTLYASILDHRLASSSKQAMYLNLLFKSLKLDEDAVRVKSFVKRFLQALLTGPGFEPSFICGGLFLLGELFNVTTGLRAGLSTPPGANAEAYDSRKREPEYSGAGEARIWELTPLLHHYHPSVSLHARQLLEGTPLTANADLSLNTISHFLDLFVYKNPKKPKPRGASAMQPAAAAGNDVGVAVRRIRGTQEAGLGADGTVNAEDFWRRKVQDVPESQLFFHKYFTQKQQRLQFKRDKVDKRKSGKDSDSAGGLDEDEDKKSDDAKSSEPSNSDEEEAEIWRVMKKSIPREEADIDDSDDEDLEIPDDGDEDRQSASEKSAEEAGSGSGSDGDLDFAEEDEDILGSDDEAPDGLLHFDSDEDAEGPWAGPEAISLGKRKGRKSDPADGRKKRRRLKDLPLFASMEDYEKLIDGQPEDNI